MCSNPRGKALIINNQTFRDPDVYAFRLGARVDTENLDQLFTQLGFEVIKYENLKRSETIKILIDFADTVSSREQPCDMLIGGNSTFIMPWSRDRTDHDHCVAVCVLSHGKAQGKIVSSDCLDIDIEQDILRRFNNEYCPQLQVFQNISYSFIKKPGSGFLATSYLSLLVLRASPSFSSCKPVEATTETMGPSRSRLWTVLTP